MEEKSGVDRFIDSLFEMRRTTLLLILIFVLAFILRYIAAVNLAVSADDMHHVTHAINFFGADRLITYDQSSGLWHTFTSIIYNILGTTQVASRFAALIFGSMSIFVIYLLSREFFSEKTSLLAAFLLAIAPFHITNTVAEMDVMAMFFVLSGMLFFVKALKSEKRLIFLVSGIFFGLAIYTKVYPLLFIPSLLIYFMYYHKKNNKKIFTKENYKKISIFLFVAFIFAIPALTHNVLLYKDQGFLDLQFSRSLGLGKDLSAQYYSWDHQFNAENDWIGLIFGGSSNSSIEEPTLLTAINFMRLGDPMNFYLGLLGIFFIFFKRKDKRLYLTFFILSIIFVLPFLASIILLPKHFMFLEILMIPMGAFVISSITDKLKPNSRKAIPIILIIFSLLILGLPVIKGFYVPGNYLYYGKGHVAQIIDFKEQSIPENALIVGDSRIYRGRINWAFQGRPYMEGTEFINIFNNQEQIPGDSILVDVYYVECIIDDCGWGTINSQPEFNASMESLTDFFAENGQLVKTITEPIETEKYYPLFTSQNRFEIINVYHTKLQMKQQVVALASQPKKWFLYDIGYQGSQFDSYQTTGFFDTLLSKIAHWIVLLAVILAFTTPLYILYKIRKR